MSSNKNKIRHPASFETPLCAEVGPTFFFLSDDDDLEESLDPYRYYREAEAICKQCVHIDECAEWAVNYERYGFWGGLTPNQRQAIRRKRNIILNETL